MELAWHAVSSSGIIPSRYYGRNCMFIDHLIHTIFQKYHEAVKTLDLTLQFDSIYQVNGDGYSLVT